MSENADRTKGEMKALLAWRTVKSYTQICLEEVKSEFKGGSHPEFNPSWSIFQKHWPSLIWRMTNTISGLICNFFYGKELYVYLYAKVCLLVYPSLKSRTINFRSSTSPNFHSLDIYTLNLRWKESIWSKMSQSNRFKCLAEMTSLGLQFQQNQNIWRNFENRQH